MEDEQAEIKMETEETTEIKPEPEETLESKVDPAAPPHPYAEQLSNFKLPENQLTKIEVVRALSLESTPLTIVSTQDALDGMLKKLREVKEVAIGVHVHSYRSFHEICCLLGISTRSEDFLVDAMALKDELSVLNEIFIDESVLKVMYFADRDLERLQRCVGLYMINLMDNSVADVRLSKGAQTKQMNFAQALKCHCGVELVDKTDDWNSNAGDWKVRPLTENMVKYARQRVHYLLSMKDILQNSIVEKGFAEEVYKECTEMCTEVWYPEKHGFKPDAYINTYNRSKGRKFEGYNQQQLECLRLIFEWRWHTAELKDESLSYTMPNKMMLMIAGKLPTDMESLKKACGETIPPLVEEHLEDIRKLVLKALENVPEAGEPVDLPKMKTKRGSRGRGDYRSSRNWSNRGTDVTKPGKPVKSWKRGGNSGGGQGRGGRGRGGGGGGGRGRGGFSNPRGGKAMQQRSSGFTGMRSNYPNMMGPGMGPIMRHGMGPRMGLMEMSMGMGMGNPGMGMHNSGMGMHNSGMGMPRPLMNTGMGLRRPPMDTGMGMHRPVMGMGMAMNFGFDGSW